MKEGYRYWIVVVATIFLGMIFMLAGLGKLLVGSNAFRPFVSPMFLPQPSWLEVFYIGIPYIEIIIGSLLILGIAVKFAAHSSLVLISCFIAYNLLVIRLGLEPCGGCFGVFGGLTAVSALILDVIMAVMVVAILICYRGSFFDIRPMVLEKKEA